LLPGGIDQVFVLPVFLSLRTISESVDDGGEMNGVGELEGKTK
jgi:hypothetical protein